MLACTMLLVCLTTTVALAATYTGTAGDDRLTGTAGDDFFYSKAGNDIVSGDIGNDTLTGGTDNDYIDATNDGERGSVTCGDGANDVAVVGLNDVVDGELVESLGALPGQVLGILTCERVEVKLS